MKLSEYSESKLNSFTDTFLSKCQIIEIRSWQVEQAIMMFNSLNSTGMPLSDADIISAQLYSKAENKEEFNNQWKRISKLANDLSQRKIINLDDVLKQYMHIKRAKDGDYIERGYTDVTTPGLRKYYLDSSKKLLDNPLLLCDSYEKIVKIWEKIEKYPIIKLILKFNENIKLYLISYLFKFEIEQINQNTVIDICEPLLRLFTVLELVDSGFSSKNFKTFLYTENINLVKEGFPAASVSSDINAHIADKWNKADLRNKLKEYSNNVLVFLNEYLYAKEHGLVFDFSDSVNIEHIMPASGRDIEAIRQDAKIPTKEEFISIVNQLGNKILLEEDINKSIGKNWFNTKKNRSIQEKTGYLNSKYNIAQKLSNYPSDTWTRDDIATATNKAIDRILKFIFNEGY